MTFLSNFKWNVRTGYRELQRQPQVIELLKAQAEKIADAAGGGFEVDVQETAGRRRTPRASVRTGTEAARRAESQDRALTRAIDAGRL